MNIIYKVSDEQLLKDRNEIFKEIGIPALKKNGFTLSTFNGAWHGEFDRNSGCYSYDFCRIIQNQYLEILDVSIHKKDRKISLYLCVFELIPNINSLNQLQGYEGIPFAMTVKNKFNYMQLRTDDYKCHPLIFMIFLPKHKIGCYYTKSGYEAKITKLKKLIKLDMENIDDFVKRWHELHKPNITDWKGNIITKNTN